MPHMASDEPNAAQQILMYRALIPPRQGVLLLARSVTDIVQRRASCIRNPDCLQSKTIIINIKDYQGLLLNLLTNKDNERQQL